MHCHYNDLEKAQISPSSRLSLDLSYVPFAGTEMRKIEDLRARLCQAGGELVLENLNSVQLALLHMDDRLQHYLPDRYSMATDEWKDGDWRA